MPGISQGYSIAAAINIEEAMRDIFSDKKLLEDAHSVLKLMEKAHIWEDRMLESHIMLMRLMFWVLSIAIVLGSILTLFIKPARLEWTMALVWFVPILTVAECVWSEKRRRKALERLDSLIKSKPEYWEPLIARVKQILVNYGNAEHSLLGSRQVIKLNDEIF